MSSPDLRCEKCLGPMEATTVPKHGTGLRVVGHTLWIPCAAILGLLTMGIIFAPYSPNARVSVPALGCAILMVYGALLVPIIIGLVLLGRRKVWKCKTCGFLFDRG